MPGFEFTVPVLIAGGGAAGVVAGLAAANAGVDVLLVEQEAAPSGSTGMSQGMICAAGTAAQAQAGVEDSADRLYADIMAKTRGLTDATLARAISDASGPCIDWLVEQHDVPLTLDIAYRAGFGHSRPRLHGWEGHNGQDLLDLLHSRFSSATGQVLARARLDGIVTEEGRVTGAEIVRPGGERDRIGCGALILACGGFAANRSLVARNMPEAAAAIYNGHDGSRGDGIEIAQGLGAATVDMGSYQGYGLLTTPQMITLPPRLVQEGAFLVNAQGARFVDETEDVTGLIHPVLAQPGGCAWLVFDEHVRSRCAETVELRQLNDLKAPRSGQTAAELAAQIGVSGELLTAALQDIQSAKHSKHPDPFGRIWPDDFAPELPLHALKVTGALYHTQGGLSICSGMRVRDVGGKAISGLYAAGGTARGLSGPSYWGYLPAMGLGSAVAGGLIAGRGSVHDRAT